MTARRRGALCRPGASSACLDRAGSRVVYRKGAGVLLPGLSCAPKIDYAALCRGVKPAPAGRFVCAGTSPHLYAATTVDPPPRFMEGTACGENGFGSFFIYGMTFPSLSIFTVRSVSPNSKSMR